MMALNRYRLKTRAEAGQRSARLIQHMLNQPDKLLGTILLGNNLVNNAAAALATLIALKLYGEVAIAFATGLITLIILVFAEVPPKTVAAIFPERVAYPASYVVYGLMRLLNPVVTLINAASHFMLKIFSITVGKQADPLSAEELRTVVEEAGPKIPNSHKDMLLRILALESITVDDVMVPRSAIEAIDLDDEWENILEQLQTSHHTRLPVYRNSVDNMLGELHLRKVLSQINNDEFHLADLENLMQPLLFIPAGSKLTQQLLELQKQRRQMGLVVDEYGDIQGLVSLDEILEEIVGEFTAYVPGIEEDVHQEADGRYLVSGSANIRDLNRKMGWSLPTDGPKTLNGLIVEQLEDIPAPGISLRLADYPVEIVQTKENAVSVARILSA